jgi:isopentenyl-diphosphate delta-isomerase, type 1
MEMVVLVDEGDREIGLEEKLAAHLKGKLHRALSVFIFNTRGELLIQQRAFSKYHSGGLWTNTCCSHPRLGEGVLDAAERRLDEEMGIRCPLKKVFEFTYRAELDNNIVEHEFDHVFVGKYEGEVKPDPQEAESLKWVNTQELLKDIERDPKSYTYWFKLILAKVVEEGLPLVV